MKVREQKPVKTICLVLLFFLAFLQLPAATLTMSVLTVSAKERSTGKMNEITITNYKDRMSAEEIRKLMKEALNYRVEDKKFLRKAKAVNALYCP